MSRAATDLVEAVVAAVEPRDVLFWTGSGISLDAPTCLPSGVQLTERVADQFFLPATLDTMRSYYQALRVTDSWNEPREFPRLEFLLGIAEAVFGGDAAEVLSDMDSLEPNWLHRFYAEHLALGGQHITANFDEAIEASVSDPLVRGNVIHFHGSYDPRGTEHLGMTIARIEQGLATGTADEMATALGSAKVLIVAGYSGSDYFDIDPFIAQMAAVGELSHLTVLWIAHSNSKNGVQPVGSTFPLPLPRLMANAGCDIWWLEASTRHVHERIASIWDVVVIEPSTCAPQSWEASWEPEKRQRLQASLQLWHSMGVPRETAALLQLFDGSVPAGRCNVEAMVAWLGGRYTDARRSWAQCPQDTKEDALHVRERTGATLWVSGRLIRAYWVLSRSIRYGQKNGIDVLASTETRSRVVEHMGRTPELRWLSRLLSQRPGASLPSPETAPTTQSRIRLTDIQRTHDDRTPNLEQLEELIEGFVQVESLNGMLNYRHRQLRDRVAAGQIVEESDYRRQSADQMYIGATGDAGSVMFLPGAESAFSWREMRASATAIQFSRWQRLRVSGFWLISRIRDLMKRGRVSTH